MATGLGRLVGYGSIMQTVTQGLLRNLADTTSVAKVKDSRRVQQTSRSGGVDSFDPMVDGSTVCAAHWNILVVAGHGTPRV